MNSSNVNPVMLFYFLKLEIDKTSFPCAKSLTYCNKFDVRHIFLMFTKRLRFNKRRAKQVIK